MLNGNFADVVAQAHMIAASTVNSAAPTGVRRANDPEVLLAPAAPAEAIADLPAAAAPGAAPPAVVPPARTAAALPPHTTTAFTPTINASERAEAAGLEAVPPAAASLSAPAASAAAPATVADAEELLGPSAAEVPASAGNASSSSDAVDSPGEFLLFSLAWFLVAVAAGLVLLRQHRRQQRER